MLKNIFLFFSVYKSKKCVWYHSLNNMFVYLKNRNVFGMCVFNLKKADTFDRINIFLFRRENTLYSCCSSLRLFLLFPFSSLRAENQTHALNSSPSMQQKIDWDSRSLDLISIVSMPRPSNLQGFCRHRPITPRSKFESPLSPSFFSHKFQKLWPLMRVCRRRFWMGR